MTLQRNTTPDKLLERTLDQLAAYLANGLGK